MNRLALFGGCVLVAFSFPVGPMLAVAGETNLRSFPAIDGLSTSEEIRLEVNGVGVWVEEFASEIPHDALPSWFHAEPNTHDQAVCIANFACDGPITVTITTHADIGAFSIHPKSRNLNATKSGKQLTLKLPGPDKLYVKIGELPPLCLFANAIRGDLPDPSDEHVRYFGPGVHHAGDIVLQDNDTLLVDGGAIVYARLRGHPKNARVIGNGIIDGQYKRRLVYLEDAERLLVCDVILRNGRGWQNTLVGCRDVQYRDVKVISFGNSGDGINPVGSSNVSIDDCFLRCTDDCIAIKAMKSTHVVENIRVTGCTMIGHAFSDGVTIGYETNGPFIRDILVQNCDIVTARGGSKIGSHSAFSIICDGPARISNIRYEDIRVEEDVPQALEIHISDGTLYGIDPPGHVSDVSLKNVSWESVKPIVIKGFDAAHRVEKITFDHCQMGGEKLTAANLALHSSVNEFIDRVECR